MVQCDFCGRYRPQSATPHPDCERCPYRSNHEFLDDSQDYPDETLVEAIRNTVPGNSVALRGWNSGYPLFRTVFETRGWTPSESTTTTMARGFESPDVPYWRKTIWTMSDHETLYRIEYDPASPSLVDWYEVTEESETQQPDEFEAFARKESSDISYFGASY